MRPRILLVEPDPTIRKHLAALLERLGYACASVATLVDAMAEARREPCALIIVDLDLAGGDPDDCAARLRAAAPAARLIALDSDGLPALDAYDALIPKPFLADPLLAAIPGLLPTDSQG